MPEIIDYIGDICLWQGQDGEGRTVYASRRKYLGMPVEPVIFSHYCIKDAWREILEEE